MAAGDAAAVGGPAGGRLRPEDDLQDQVWGIAHETQGWRIQLKRPVDSRNSLLRNLCTSMIETERMVTTVTKAKAVRPLSRR